MTMSAQQVAKLADRADAAISDLTTNGGLLNPQQANTFIDMILDEPTMLRQVRTQRMDAPEVRINRVGFAQRIMRAAPTTGGANDNGTNSRVLAAADRSKPTTSQIKLTSKEVLAEIRIPYEFMEDNLEGAAFEAHLMKLIAQRAALDLEEWALWADTSSTDPYLALDNGWLKRCSAHIADNASVGINPDMVADALLALPQKYLKYLSQMKAFVSVANTIRYRQKVSKRETGYGDSALQDTIPLRAHGLTLEGAPMLNADGVGATGLVTFPQNLIFGIRRDITVETERNIRSREHIIVLTARVGLQVDDTDAAVRLEHI